MENCMIKCFIPVLAVLALSGCAADADSENDDTVSTNAGAAVAPGTYTGGTGGVGTAVLGSCSTATTPSLVSTINDIRAAMGAPAFTCDANLNKATAWHAYYHGNHTAESAHTETAGHTGFTGANSGDRDSNAGFTGSPTGEVWAGSGTYSEAINHPRWGWMSSLFHRTPYMSFSNNRYGFGSYRNTSGAVSEGTMDFGSVTPATPAATATLVWPKNGSTTALTKFYCTQEGPVVCPTLTYPQALGAVISITTGANIATITTHTLKTAAGAAVSHTLYTNSTPTFGGYIPANHAAMVPAAALAVNTSYTAVIAGTVTRSGVTSSFTKTWSFRTATTDN
jgi:uncharacterized protein YkwD